MFKCFLFVLLCISLQAADFTGWEGLRVLPVEGSVSASSTGDVTGTGLETLFIANRRQSRIDIYNWLPPEKRKKAEKPNSPNDLPFASDFERSEIVLERPPFDIHLKNLDEDKELELIVLTTLPLTLHLYDLKQGKWSVKDSWKLPNERLQSLSFLSVQDAVLISTDKGVLIQELIKGKTAQWMKPKESGIRRLNWWEYDIDQDGKKDLVDLVIDESDRARFRWFKRSAGIFLPAVPLGDIKGTNGKLDVTAGEATFFIQNPIRSNTVNEYTLHKGDESKFAKNRILPIKSYREELSTSITIDGKKCLVEIDPSSPTMRVSELTESGFVELGNFPVLRQTKAVVAPRDESFILMQVGDSPDLYVSKWEKGRFTYPKLYKASESKKEFKLLGFGIHGNTTWWVRSSESDIYLHTLQARKEVSVLDFKGIGKGYDKAYWLGGSSLMVRKKYAKSALFYTLKDGKPTSIQAAHLKDAAESQFRFFALAGKLQVSRIIDGIIQWYGEDLQPIDQVMLEDGSKIMDAAYLGDSLMALDQTGQKIHELKKDASGLMKEVKSYEVLNSSSIKNDDILGVLLGNTKFLNAVATGKPLEFKLKNSINEKLGLPSGVKQAKISSFRILDVAGSKRNELLNIDYNRHQLTLIDIDEKQAKSLASWKVYDDGKYPYSDGTNGSAGSANPYMALTLDFDGDGIKEMVLGCHDRLLVYLGRETEK